MCLKAFPWLCARGGSCACSQLDVDVCVSAAGSDRVVAVRNGH